MSQDRTVNQANPHWKFSVEQYAAMSKAGILTEDDRTELIDGEILAMASKHDGHVACLAELTQWFYVNLAGLARILVQDPVILSERDEPEPDLMLVHLPEGGRLRRKPRPSDVYLIIEVADTTLRHDRRKLVRYALAGIAEVWIVNLAQRVVEVYREPRGEQYAISLLVREGHTLAPIAFPDAALAWSDVFPD